MNKQTYLDNLVKKYETHDFIKDDPVQFPQMFKEQRNREISGLIASCLAYGRRDKIIESINVIHKIMEFEPHNFCTEFNISKDAKLFKNFKHRFNTGQDIALLISAIGTTVNKYGSLEQLFMNGYSKDDKNIKNSLYNFVTTIKENLPESASNTSGFDYLIVSPEKGSACKRLNLFIKWMTRKGPVDMNLWKNIATDKLIIPLDTHVAKLSRKLDLTSRKSNDWIAAEEITDNLKKYDPKDPVKYDFALFGMGVNRDC